jgi:hypothetical protein
LVDIFQNCVRQAPSLKSSTLCLYSSNLGTFWLKIEQFWPFEEISIFSNGGHLGYRTALDGHNFERYRPRDHPCQVWFNLFSGFRGEDLNVIFFQNMPNLHNRYISQNVPKFELYKHNVELFSIYYRIFL